MAHAARAEPRTSVARRVFMRNCLPTRIPVQGEGERRGSWAAVGRLKNRDGGVAEGLDDGEARAGEAKALPRLQYHVARAAFFGHPYRALEHLQRAEDRKSTRLNSSHGYISYAVFCL